ncbi:MAG: PAS domain S-box protein [Gammaproteobacteria bacterium]
MEQTLEKAPSPPQNSPQSHTEWDGDRFFDLSVDMLATVSIRDGHWRRVNPAFHRTLGWSEDALLAMPYLDLVHPKDQARSREAVGALAAGKSLTGFENRVHCKDGAYKRVAWNMAPDLDEGLIYCVGRDITDRNVLDRALEESEKRYRLVAENLPGVAVFIVDRDLRYLVAEGAALADAGFTSSDFVGKTIFETLEPELARSYESYYRSALSGDVFETEHEVRERSYLTRGVPLKDEETGEVTAVLALSYDISARKRAEAALRQSDDFTRRVLDGLFAFVGVLDLDGTLMAANRVPLEAAGLTLDDVRGKKFWDCPWWSYSPPVQAQLREACARAATGEVVRYDVPVRMAGNSRLMIDFQIGPLYDEQGRITHLIPSAIDITEKKEAEAALRESEERYALVTAGAGAAIWDWNVPGKRVLFSPRWKAMRGLSNDEVSDREEEWSNGIHPADIDRVMTAVRDHFEGRTEVFSEEYRVHHKDGRWIWIWDRGIAQRDNAGNVIRMAGSETDITARKQAEEALRQSREDFDRAQAVGQMGWWRLDTRQNMLTWSDENHRIFGVPKGTPLTYEALLAMVYPDDRAYVDAQWTAGLHGAPYDIEHRIVADGRVKWVREKAYLEFDRQGVLLGGFGITQDITARKLAEAKLLESEARFQTLANGSPALLWVNGCEGCEFVNRAYLEFLGLEADVEVRGYDWSRFVHEEDRERYVGVYLRAFESGAVFSAEFRFRRFDGEWRWMRSEAIPRLNVQGRCVGYVGATIDITKTKQIEEQLREADRKKDEFLATLAHELRNPLAPIRNGLEIMNLAGNDVGMVEKARDMMERQINQMTRLIDDLMDVSRISRGLIVLQKTKVRLAEAVRDAVDTSRPLIKAQGHELVIETTPEPIDVDGDLTRLSQVFANLLNNAAKFTGTGGRIGLTVERQGGDVVVSVEDNGVGIPAAMLNTVFDMFAQVDRSFEKSQGGLGLGLNIAKRLVEMHGGSISAESGGLGLGSTFTVRLPVVLSVTNAKPDYDSDEKSKPAARRRILVVDDNRDGAASLAMMLNIMGNETQTAHDGLEAVAVAEAFRPDVILMDIGMPKLNGFDACRRIRKEPWGRSIVIVAQTGWGREEVRRKAMACGFDCHMIKPIDPAALETLLAEMQVTTR